MMRGVNGTLPGKEHAVDRILPDYKRPPKHVPKKKHEKTIRGGEGWDIDGKGKAKKAGKGAAKAKEAPKDKTKDKAKDLAKETKKETKEEAKEEAKA